MNCESEREEKECEDKPELSITESWSLFFCYGGEMIAFCFVLFESKEDFSLFCWQFRY